LIEEDIYLDIRFTSWTNGFASSSPGFALERAVPPSIETTGDYNGDGTVNAADYTVWRDTLGQNVDPGTGADGEPDGTIDVADYNFWKSKFGNVIAGTGATSVAVPEPTTTLILSGLFVFAARLRKRITPRGPGHNF
jgi:hypothetical protein